MKKRVISLMAAVLLALSVPAYAVSTRVMLVQPILTFDGTTATYSVDFIGSKPTDKAVLTLTLYQGSRYLASWTSSGEGHVHISKSREVERGKEYTLELTWSVNGVTQQPVTVTKVCP